MLAEELSTELAEPVRRMIDEPRRDRRAHPTVNNRSVRGLFAEARGRRAASSRSTQPVAVLQTRFARSPRPRSTCLGDDSPQLPWLERADLHSSADSMRHHEARRDIAQRAPSRPTPTSERLERRGWRAASDAMALAPIPHLHRGSPRHCAARAFAAHPYERALGTARLARCFGRDGPRSDTAFA
jgi:hypothetical protein